MNKPLTIILNITGGIGLFAAGSIITKLIDNRKNMYAGTLRIDNSDPSSPNCLFLELNMGVNELSKANTVTLKVLDKSYISH